jgi:hypothetical protein
MTNKRRRNFPRLQRLGAGGGRTQTWPPQVSAVCLNERNDSKIVEMEYSRIVELFENFPSETNTRDLNYVVPGSCSCNDLFRTASLATS